MRHDYEPDHPNGAAVAVVGVMLLGTVAGLILTAVYVVLRVSGVWP